MIVNIIEIRLLFCIALCSSCASSHPHFSGFRNTGFGPFSYADPIPYETFIQSFPESNMDFYLSQQQPLNLILEAPQVIGTTFSVLPMFAVPEDNVNMVSSTNIVGVSSEKPMLMIRTESNSLLQCIPGVRIELEQPLWLFASKKTSIVFPSEVLIYHGDYRIPLKVGALLAPVTQDSFFYNQVPVEVRVVYAVPVPSKPISVETVTIQHHVQNTTLEILDNQAVVVESDNHSDREQELAGLLENPKNVTIFEFSNTVALPTNPVNDEDEELRIYLDETDNMDTVIDYIGDRTDNFDNQSDIKTPSHSNTTESQKTRRKLLKIFFRYLHFTDVNRNPPQVLAPAGIVQSTQPEIIIEPFHNSKESPVLTQLKDEKLKQKLKMKGSIKYRNGTNSEFGCINNCR